MAENSKIEWTDHTMNFWIGCQEVSPACDHCYARVQNEHWKWVNGWGADGERRRTSTSNWHKLRKWNRDARQAGIRAKVFSNSLSDFFDNKAASAWRREAWHYIEQSPDLDFLILTKRPQNISKMLPDPETGVKPWGNGWPNVWLGTTCENQEEADRRIPHLLKVPAAVRFLSCEPLLSFLDIGWALSRSLLAIGAGFLERGHFSPGLETLRPIDWVIAGGESGPGARPMHPIWARSLLDQCRDVGVPFFFKQWGEWTPGVNVERTRGTVQSASWFDDQWDFGSEDLSRTDGHIDDEPDLYRVGKKAAGALLDGVEWRQSPGGAR